jgi:hypothetical protein
MANVANLGNGGLKPLRFADSRGIMEQSNKRCSGEHDIHVAEVLYVPAEGKLVVVNVCRSCDTTTFHERIVAQPHHDGELLKQGK